MEPRKLLPKPKSSETDRPLLSRTPISSFAGLIPKKKKAFGRFACDTCRSRKSACDGQRPTCSTCRTRRTVCIYKERDKVRPDEYNAELLERLRDSSEAESLDLLQRLRATAEPASPSKKTDKRDRDRTPQASNSCLAELTLAPKTTGINLELMARYSTKLNNRTAWGFPGQYERELRNEFTMKKKSPVKQPTTDPIHSDPSPAYCDARLSRVDMNRWTDVSIIDQLAAAVLSFYLETDYPIHGLFDADLFLHDLVSGEHHFCSPMLVSAILGWSCQAYRATEARVAAYTTLFFQEGMRRWEAEEHRNTLTSVAAAHLLTMTATAHGKDDVASYYLQEAVTMGHAMGLYGAVGDSSAKSWLDHHYTWIRAASHTAWGGYCSAVHHSLQYQTPMVEYPPLLPIPGQLGSVLNRQQGARFDSYPMPSYAGQTFNKLCELFQIAHKFLWEYYDGEGTAADTPIKRVSLPFAEKIFRELLTWSASLPLDLVRADGNSHHAILLHMYFHCLVLDVFRPFLDRSTARPLVSFEADQNNDSVDIVYRASINQSKRLVLFYLTKFNTAAHSALWRPTLIYVLNSLVRDVRLSSEPSQTREQMCYFRACMFGLSKQLRCFHITDKIVQGILSMAVRDQVMSRLEASKMLQEMRREIGAEAQVEVGGDTIANDGKSTFIIDLDLAMRNPLAATVDVLVDQFDNLAMLADVASMVIDTG